jgi:required for meiotic nuclear division protein 1
MECLSYCIANSIDLTRLDNHYKTALAGYSSIKSRDTLKIRLNDESRNVVFVFKNGTVVSWGIKRHKMEPHLETIRIFADKPISFKVHDEFSYQVGNKISIEPHDFFDVDCVLIDAESDEIKLSISYGFSQSVKLQYFETILESLIEKFTPIIHRLSNKGGLSVTRSQIRHVIAEILGAKSEMNLISNFLSHPKYFWQHPTLEEHFIMLERYLHIQRRVNAINHRLDTLNEIFNMFSGYLENRHAHHLEIIIIVLITIEILSNTLNFHF